MQNFYRKNLNKLSEKYPDLFKSLKDDIEKFERYPEGFGGERFKWENSQGPNFFYKRDNPPFEAKYCGINPDLETQELMRSCNLEHPSLMVIFGLGLGHGLKAFLKSRPHTNFAILVIEKNPQIFLRALCAQDWTSEFDDETIDWMITGDLQKLNTSLLTFFTYNSTIDRYLKIIPTPAALASESDFYTEAGRLLLSIRDHITVMFGNSVADQLLGLTNALENTDYALVNPGILPLHDQFRGRLCISVAAGPSANEHFEALKEVQGKIPIFACESILKPLNDYGIYPDFVTAIERDDYVPKFFRNIKVHERSSLVAPMILMKECFDLYTGDKILYAPAQGWVNPIGIDYLGTFFPGSSAGNLNLAFAAMMGFQTVIMVGHNLAYGYGTHETHVRGTIDPDRERSRTEEELQKESGGRKIMTQDGTTEVWTRMEWDLFRTQINNLIASFPDRDWINTSPKGAILVGAKLMTFQEALEKYYKGPFDIYPEKLKLLKAATTDEVDERINQMKQKAGRALASVAKWQDKGLEILKKIQKWEKKIEQKELQGGNVSLDFLNECIDEVLEVKVGAVNKDPHFYSLAIIMMFPVHVAFERSLNEMRATYKDDYTLKRDFLLRHKQYFQVWKEVLPDITSKLERMLERYEDRQISAWGSD